MDWPPAIDEKLMSVLHCFFGVGWTIAIFSLFTSIAFGAMAYAENGSVWGLFFCLWGFSSVVWGAAYD